MDALSPRQLFIRAVSQPESHIDLAEVALYIAQEEYPYFHPGDYLCKLDQMAAVVKKRLPQERYPLRVIQTINQYLYEDLGFSGNRENYYDPCNSFLNQVIDRRQGIPITLALVYLEIAKRIDFPMVGIGMPGHFLMRPDFADSEIFVDAFHQGEILFPQDCENRLAQIYGRKITLHPNFVTPVRPRRFLVRMLNNLKMIYMNQRNLYKAFCAVDRALLVIPNMPMELRDRGLLQFQLGQWQEALADLEKYLGLVPQAEDAEAIGQLIIELKKT
jgi:regulator of sirC expression with transglutaminase-like and TPR domain